MLLITILIRKYLTYSTNVVLHGKNNYRQQSIPVILAHLMTMGWFSKQSFPENSDCEIVKSSSSNQMAFYRRYKFYSKLFEIFGYSPALSKTGLFYTIFISFNLFIVIIVFAVNHREILFNVHPIGYLNDVIWSVSIFVTYPVLLIRSLLDRKIQIEFWMNLKMETEVQCSGAFLKRFWAVTLLFMCTRGIMFQGTNDEYWLFFCLTVPWEFGIHLYLLKFVMYLDCYTQEIRYFCAELKDNCNEGVSRRKLLSNVVEAAKNYQDIYGTCVLIKRVFGLTAGLILLQSSLQLVADAFFWYWYASGGLENVRSNFLR